MCVFSKPDPVKNIVPQPTAAPEKEPDPVEIKKDSQTKVQRKRNPLRIDLASGSSTTKTGVNV
ncbi:hypothetical protein [Parasphingorhabdus sp.]|uniref:hypothetical protein n=1 Tax=Parasphingorhabdus sp. TaxID=2709688 RepID=UPI003A8E1589